MFERAQSENIGVILLTAVITLTITGAGAVVLSEWQADIQEGPIADIESEMTPINATLEHRGGDTLYPNETTIKLVGVDEEVTLSDPFTPGTSEDIDTSNFSDGPHGFLDGRFELLVIHDPTETVVHSETHNADPTLDELVFEIADRSDPAYVLNDTPANYTVKEVFDFEVDGSTVTRNATDRANLTTEDSSKLDVNESASTITGNEMGTVNVTAEVDNESAEMKVKILESDPPLNVETLEANATDLTSAIINSSLTNLGGLPEVDVGIEYWSVRSFNRLPRNNGDNVIAGGTFHEGDGPNGYLHNGFIHDNKPFKPGENRSYTYKAIRNTPDLRVSLRDTKELNDNRLDEIDQIPYPYPYEWVKNDIPNGDTVKLTAEYTDDGSAFNFYIDKKKVETFSGLNVHNELYFTTYDRNGLRLIEIADRGESETTITERDVESRNYPTGRHGLTPDKQYYAAAYAEADIAGRTIADTGQPVPFSTDTPTVETVDTTTTSITSVTVSGNLTSIGDANSVNRSFEYKPANRTFVENITNNDDKLIADGEFVKSRGLDGYTHSRFAYIHDNVPYEPGDGRTYYLYQDGSGAELWGALRTAEQTEPNRSINSIDEINGEAEEIDDGLSTGVIHRVEVEYGFNGSQLTVSVDGTPKKRWRGLEAYDDLYFSTQQLWGDSGTDSLRLIAVDQAVPENIKTASAGPTSTEGEFSEDLNGVEPGRSYDVTAVTEPEADWVNSTSRGDPLRTTATTEPTVETEAAAGTGSTTINAVGNLTERGEMSTVNLAFEHKPANRTFVENATNNTDKLIADGPFVTSGGPDGYAHDRYRYIHDNAPYEPGDRRTYYLYEAGSGGDLWGALRTAEQTEPNGSINSVRGVEEIDDRLSTGAIHRVEVEYGKYGSEVTVYVDGTAKKAWQGLEKYGDLYFSTKEQEGWYGENSLRLIAVDPLPENIEIESVGTTSTEGEFSTELSGLEPKQAYDVTAITNQTVDRYNITDRGQPKRATTNGTAP